MFKPFDLTGKVALVTGGAGGIGLGMATALAQAGADIVIWDISLARCKEAAKELTELGSRVLTQTVDVTDEGQVADAMHAAIAKLGQVDAVIANAGILGEAIAFDKTSIESWRQVQSINLEGTFLTLREAVRHMKRRAGDGRPGGSLIGIASLAAIDGTPRGEPYSASKGAIVCLMRSLAVEYARYGIRANAIAPGWIATPLTQHLQEDPVVTERVIPRIPIRRWGKPEDLGGLAIYLASDASSYHTGDIFVIDGGYTAF